ncbi:polysaccharide biosynthesis protein [Treponema phagedenis]|nr:nucleoside-diphosphate sugar epimerase/dehydratase [Treponema phagedenis]TYT78707.1 polysaccharide biosynthesis protein [Treponema phagedenis]
MLLNEIQKKEIFGSVAAFLDDDPEKIGTKIHGVPVLGPINEVASLIRITRRDEALIAIPSITIERLREIYALLKTAGFTMIKLLPALSQIIDGTAHLIQTREINPQDLLARTPVKIGLKKSLQYLRGKRVLITGAGGSIGSELARQLLSGGAERLYLLGHGENSIYQIDKELRKLQEGGVGEKATIVPIIGELKDRDYTNYIIKQLRCDAVFHTAAYKHVPMMERNPVAVIENNVFGTKNLLDACIAHDVKRFVLISTDKAVDPISIYGVSKMLNEKNLLAAAAQINGKKNQDAAYMFVRFGNVLGSRGSIFPLFMEQIQCGGPVTVTDPQMTRFFMTIPEACSLVLQTGGVGINGQSYLLDMGEPVNILETAKQLIRFHGYEPEKDIPIEIIGVRPGERLTEPLWSSDEAIEKTGYPKILRLHEKTAFDIQRLETIWQQLYPYCFYTGDEAKYRNKEGLLQTLKDLGLV